MLELVERRVLGVEQASVSAEEVVVDCADGSGERPVAPEVVRFGHGHLLRTCRARARALGRQTVLHPGAGRNHLPVTVRSTAVDGRLAAPPPPECGAPPRPGGPRRAAPAPSRKE